MILNYHLLEWYFIKANMGSHTIMSELAIHQEGIRKGGGKKGPTRYQITVSVEGRELNISWTLLTQSQRRDKDKPAVSVDTPRSGYILLGVCF